MKPVGSLELATFGLAFRRPCEHNMTTPTAAQRIDYLLSKLEGIEPVSFDLGTPQLSEGGAIQEIVGMGEESVPLLLERIRSSESKKRIAYIVLVLNRIGDSRALAPLLDLRERYQRLKSKDQWDYAVIGQSNLAIEHLQKMLR